MNKFEIQILENQLFILGSIKINDFQDSNAKTLLMKNTLELLEPTKDKEDCCDMSEGVPSRGQD